MVRIDNTVRTLSLDPFLPNWCYWLFLISVSASVELPSFPGLFHPLSSAADVSYLTLPVGDTGALQPSPLSAHPYRTPVLLKCRSVLPAPVILDSSRGQQLPAGHILDAFGSLPTTSETSVSYWTPWILEFLTFKKGTSTWWYAVSLTENVSEMSNIVPVPHHIYAKVVAIISLCWEMEKYVIVLSTWRR